MTVTEPRSEPPLDGDGLNGGAARAGGGPLTRGSR